MKGIIRAGGTGTRLYPAMLVVNKQLLPVYDKPMIYYPLSTLMLAGIRDIFIIFSPEYLPHYRTLFGNGSVLGLDIAYVQQACHSVHHRSRLDRGRASGARARRQHLFRQRPSADAAPCRRSGRRRRGGATIFSYRVEDSERYGVIEFDADSRAVSIEEKTERPVTRSPDCTSSIGSCAIWLLD